GLDAVRPVDRAEVDLEGSFLPVEQAVERVLTHQAAELSVEDLALAEVDAGRLARGLGEADRPRLPAHLEGLDEVDHTHVGEAAGKGPGIPPLQKLLLPLLGEDGHP